MNRRDALKTGLAALLPTWALRSPSPRVPLEKFCGRAELDYGRFKLAAPFVQEAQDSRLYSFATNAAVCVRVDARNCDKGDGLGRLPPAGDKLPWYHDKLSGWKPWPKERYLLAADSPCPTCEGFGTNDKKFAHECRACDGLGMGSCKWCNGTGIQPSAGGWCRDCAGGGVSNAPDIQPLAEGWFAESLQDRLIRSHLRDVEWTLIGPNTAPSAYTSHIIAFRFDGGLGLLMPLDPVRVRERLVPA